MFCRVSPTAFEPRQGGRCAPSTTRRDRRADGTTPRLLGARLLSRLPRTAVRITSMPGSTTSKFGTSPHASSPP